MQKRNLRENKRNSSSPPSTVGQKSKYYRIPKNIAWFAAAILVTALFSSSYRTVDASKEEDDFWNGSFEHEDDKEKMETIVNVIVGIVVFFFVAVVAFICCLCCPICLLAKMRGRRRGVVYRSAVTTNNGTTVTTQQNRAGTTITVTGPPRPQQQQLVTPTVPTYSSANNTPSVIAISNAHQQQSKPYPVQESVTVVPVISAYPQHPQMMNPAGYPPQQQVPYQHQAQYDASQSQPQQYCGPADPPPPYPGLTREIDANSPYNPYYTEGAHQASAPPSKE